MRYRTRSSLVIIIVVFLLIPFEFGIKVFRGFISALQKFKLLLFILVFSALLSLIGSFIGLVLLKQGIQFLIIMIVVNIFICILIILWRIRHRIAFQFNISLKKIKKMISYGIKNYLFFIVYFVNYVIRTYSFY